MQELIISQELAGGRLDKMVLRYLDRAPKGFVYKMLRRKNIVLNGKKAQGNELLREGDSIRFFLAEDTIRSFQSEAGPKPEKMERRRSGSAALPQDLIVFEDENLLAVNKPAGLLSQKAAPSDHSLNEMIADYLAGKEPPEGVCSAAVFFTPGISNRLDRNTSGIVLTGKNPAASRELNRAIRERSLDKFYFCLVKGCITEKQSLDGFLTKDEKTNTVRVYEILPEGQKASRIRTVYAPVCTGKELTLLEVELITGKSHQIRAHLASERHPVIGDPRYGDRRINAAFKEKYGLSAQLLHAGRIAFCNMQGPLSYLNGRKIHAPLPPLFDRILRQELGWPT